MIEPKNNNFHFEPVPTLQHKMFKCFKCVMSSIVLKFFQTLEHTCIHLYLFNITFTKLLNIYKCLNFQMLILICEFEADTQAKGCRMNIQISFSGWKDLVAEICLNANNC